MGGGSPLAQNNPNFMAGMMNAMNQGLKEAAKPDFLDMDKDGDKKEPMKKAVKDKDEEKKVEESIFALTNQWRAFKG